MPSSKTPCTVPIFDTSVAAALIAPNPSSMTSRDGSYQQKINIEKNDTAEQDETQKKSSVTIDERFYAADPVKLQKLRDEKPWTKSDNQQPEQSLTTPTTTYTSKRPVAKFFASVALSPSAVTKMMMHCQSGVEKGISLGGNPIEVMGLMLGRPDPFKPSNLIVTDAFPLPIEGFETRVIADDQSVINHMISLGERLEETRREKFMGWYHSHPFDLVLGEESRSHCFLSQTDLSTQLQWQRAEDPHGNPFCAIVVDPLRSMYLGTPQLKAFRAYPPEYQSNIANECPDKSVISSERLRLERWGSCWNRYYELDVEYYMCDASRSILGDLTKSFLWMKSFEREGNDEYDESGGGIGTGVVKLSTLREIAANARATVGSSASRIMVEGGPSSMGIGRTGIGSHGIKSSAVEHVVQKLQTAAIKALTKQSTRRIQAKVFKNPL